MNPAYANVATSRGANVNSVDPLNPPLTLVGCDLAAAGGSVGVRMPVGTNSFGSPNNFSDADLRKGVGYALDKGLKVSLLFGYGPSITQELADDFNGGALWVVRNRPPQGTTGKTIGGVFYQHLWDWVARGMWQKLLDAAIDECVKRGLDPIVWLMAEGFNEMGRGGVGGPFAGSSLSTATYPPPYNVLADGQIEANFWIYSEFMLNTVNWHAIRLWSVNTEGAAGTTGQTELNSFAGAHCTNTLNAGYGVSTNQYAPAGANQAAIIAGWIAKTNTQLTRMAANAIIGARPKAIMEFGIIASRVPKCTTPNKVRQALLKTAAIPMAGLSHVAFYTLVDNGSASTGFYAYNHDKTPSSSGLVGPAYP